MKDKNYFPWIISLYVIVVYALYPHGIPSVNPHSLYQYLTEGFLSGHLHLQLAPSAELLGLSNPYDPIQNAHVDFPWDVSFFQGHYYLYFGPLPVITFHLPFKLLTGFYASESMVVFFFLTVGFLVNFYLMIKIKNEYFPRVSELQLVFVGFLMGFANGAPYLLARSLVYEEAISSAFCFISFALFFLYELINKRSRIRNAFLFGLCLSLSVAGRPHFVLLCVFLIPGVLLYLLKHSHDLTGHSRAAQVCALLAPCISVGALLGLYNYMRFGSFIDFGHAWQLCGADLREMHDKLFYLPKILRNAIFGVYYYFLQAYDVGIHFPYVILHYHLGSVPIDKDYLVESIGGVFTTAPFILMILGLPRLMMIHLKKPSRETPLCWFLLFVLLIPIIIVLFLVSLPIATQRYEVDFLPWLVMLSVISFWLWEHFDHSSFEARRLAESPRDPEILFMVQGQCTEIDRSGSRGQAAGRRCDLNGQQSRMNSKRFKYGKVLFFGSGIYSIYLGWALAVAYVIAIFHHNSV